MFYSKHHSSGFTLIEVLVAMGIMSVIFTLSWKGLDLVIEAEKRFIGSPSLDDVAIITIKQDLLHLRARSIRDGLGDFEPAYLVPGGVYPVRFTRGGRPLLTRGDSGLERIAYSVDREGWLCRHRWDAVDRPVEVDPTTHRLLPDVRSISFLQLGDDGEWTAAWPPIESKPAVNLLPKAVLVRLYLNNGEEQKIMVPGLASTDINAT